MSLTTAVLGVLSLLALGLMSMLGYEIHWIGIPLVAFTLFADFMATTEKINKYMRYHND